MKSSFLAYCGVVLLGSAACVAACANSGDESNALEERDAGRNEAVVHDSGERGPDDERDAGTEPPPDAGARDCSPSGWCRTSLPDEDLALKDVWAVPGHAFALAESFTLGIKVLEWKDADAKWDYIDDGTQNERGFGAYLGGIWAPNANEIYYGIGPGYIYHGRREDGAPTAWKWSRTALADNSHPDVVEPNDGNPFYSAVQFTALGVFGTSAENVYAWFTNTIYRLEGAGGPAPEWVAEYTLDRSASLIDHVFFHAATSTSPGTMWFSGARTRKLAPGVDIASAACALLVRRTAAGQYEKIADGTLASAFAPCAVNPDSISIGNGAGGLGELHAASADTLFAIKHKREIVKISLAGDEPSVVTAPSITAQILPTTASPPSLSSIFVASQTLWASFGSYVARADDQTIWDGGAYQLTAVSTNGAFIGDISRVRGDSNSNLWAIGVRNAFQKTAP